MLVVLAAELVDERCALRVVEPAQSSLPVQKLCETAIDACWWSLCDGQYESLISTKVHKCDLLQLAKLHAWHL